MPDGDVQLVLKKEEMDLIQKLGQCWNDFDNLPVLHPNDEAEFRQAIHVAQNIVACRALERARPPMPTTVMHVMQTGKVQRRMTEEELEEWYEGAEAEDRARAAGELDEEDYLADHEEGSR